MAEQFVMNVVAMNQRIRSWALKIQSAFALNVMNPSLMMSKCNAMFKAQFHLNCHA